MRHSARPGGTVMANVLVEGTTFMAMFDPQRYCLFPPRELAQTFADWDIVLDRLDDYPAPDASIKRFATLIARRPH
jgi:tellurite methyltransferase